MEDIILNHWQSILFALLIAARAIFSLIPSDSQAVKIFGWIDILITALVGGDRRKKKKKVSNHGTNNRINKWFGFTNHVSSRW